MYSDHTLKVAKETCDYFPANLVAFTEEILNVKPHFLCSVFLPDGFGRGSKVCRNNSKLGYWVL